MTSEQDPKKLPVRLAGIFLTFFGIILAHMGIIFPILAAKRHESSISLPWVAAIVPWLLSFGLIYAIWGDKAESFLGNPQKPQRLSKWGWLLFGVMFALGLILEAWLETTLGELGYRRR